MKTTYIRRWTRLARDLSRPKPLPPIHGIRACDARLLWTTRTWLPLIVYPALTAAIAAAPWLALGASNVAALVALWVCFEALRQARRDRTWFDIYADCTTRLAARPLSNAMLRSFLWKEYARPLLFPVLWLGTWATLINQRSWLLQFYAYLRATPTIIHAADTYLTAVTAVAFTLGAREVALRRRKDRALPVLKRELPVVRPLRYCPTYIRGTQLVTLAEAVEKQRQILPADDHGILWGGVCLPSHRCEHFFIFAVTRGGKSIVIRLLMQDILCHVGNPLLGGRRKARVLLYDPKPELLPYATAIQPYARFIVTNPSDQRCSAWNLAKDFVAIAAAAQLALLMVPTNLKERDNFYPKAVRAVLTAVFKAFMLTAPGVWTLRDVFEVMKSENDLKHLLNRHPETRGTLEQISRNEETRGNIDISIHVELAPFKTLAARWHHAAQFFSLSEWMSEESILVVGRLDEESELFDALNSLLLNRASELLLSQPDKPEIRTFMFLDELATIKNGFRKLELLMTVGLSKLVSCIIASQGVEGLKSHFGNDSTEQFLAMCGNKAFLCLSRPTAEWAANQIGKTDWLEIYRTWSKTDGTSWNRGSSQPSDNNSAYYADLGKTRQSGVGGSASSTDGATEQRHERYAQLPEEFQHIAKPNLEMNVGLRGTFMSDSGSAYGIVPTEIPADALFNQLLLPPDATTPPFIRRPPEHDLLPPWDDADRKRLGFPPENDQRTPLDTFLNH